MAALVERLRPREDELVRRMVERYRTEIVDYATASDDFIEFDVMPVTRRAFVITLDNIAADRRLPSSEQLDEFGRMLVRRPHQDIALPSLQAAFRLFAEFIFDEYAAIATRDDPDELAAVV